MNISDYKEKIELNAKNILKFINEKDIYINYLSKDFNFNTAFSSPFRLDKSPSFIIGDSSKNFRFKDFATGDSGNCFNFVMELYNINFNEALIQIINDFNIQDNFIYNNINTCNTIIKAKYENPTNNSSINIGHTSLKIKSRPFNKDDFDYWNMYGISSYYLNLGNIKAISHYFINGAMYVAEKYAYAYVEFKDNKITYKIYQPFSKYKKWINNNNYSVWELWNLLPEKGDKLIITSSRKDALSIIENLKIPSTSFQAESVMPKEQVMEEIFDRFNDVYLLYDNDYNKSENWGQKLALKLKEKYNKLTNIIIDENMCSKDFSDLVKNTSRSIASDILNNILKTKY